MFPVSIPPRSRPFLLVCFSCPTRTQSQKERCFHCPRLSTLSIMRSLFFIVALSTLALAAPSPPEPSSPPTPCLCSQDVTRIADAYSTLIGGPFSTSLAQQILSPDLIDYSDSVKSLINVGCPGPFPIGPPPSPLYTNSSGFILGQGSQPPFPFNILNVWNACETVFIRWTTPAPFYTQPEQEVTGISVIVTELNTYPDSSEPFLIAAIYAEFNSAAWLVDEVR